MSFPATRLQTQRENTNKLLRALENIERANRDTLIVESGLSPPECAAAIHQLKKLGYVTTEGESFKLTPTGRKAVPPNYVLDLARYDPASRENGYRHIHGIPGKFDYSKPLRGGLALLYDALVRPMSAADWSVAANMQLGSAWSYINKLEALGIVEAQEETNPKTGRKHKIYRRARLMKTNETEETEQATPAPKTTAESPPVVISHFSKPEATLDEAINELMKRYSPFEIMLAALARLELEYKSMRHAAN